MSKTEQAIIVVFAVIIALVYSDVKTDIANYNTQKQLQHKIEVLESTKCIP
jgi:hypothetical protein